MRRPALAVASRLLRRIAARRAPVASRPDRHRDRARRHEGRSARGVSGRRCVASARPSRAGQLPALRASRDVGAMPLLDRDDCVLVVVDAQPGFFRKDWFGDADVAAAASALDRAAWLVAVAARLAIPVVVTEEEPERNGATEPLIADRLPAGAPVLRKDTFGLAASPGIIQA